MLIAANVGLYLLTSANPIGFSANLNELGRSLALFGPAVHDGEYYRLISSAFLHFGLMHIAFNMYALYWLGSALESYVGSLRFGAIYLISALTGSFGALLLSPNALTAGASAAIFGLMGALLVLERQRGISLLEGPIGGLLLVNLLFTFAFSGQISVGGHIGGLIGRRAHRPGAVELRPRPHRLRADHPADGDRPRLAGGRRDRRIGGDRVTAPALRKPRWPLVLAIACAVRRRHR